MGPRMTSIPFVCNRTPGQRRAAVLTSFAVSTIPERIREILALREWNERELCRRSGLSEAHVNKLVQRKAGRPSAETLVKIAEGASVSLLWLMTGDGPIEDTETPASPADGSRRRLELALAKAFDAEQHELSDLDAVRAMMSRLDVDVRYPEADLAGPAKSWLDAAMTLRMAGVPVSPTELIAQLTIQAVPRKAAVVANPSAVPDGAKPVVAAHGTRPLRKPLDMVKPRPRRG